MKKNIKNKILEAINNFDRDYIFISNDFYDIAEYETIRKNLNRFVESGEIKRIIKGVYYKPKYIEFIDEYSYPSIPKVADAIARKYNWSIAPSGNTSLNMLGLDTQVPAKYTYISDGRYMKYDINGVTIEFKRRNNSEISNMNTYTAMVIQALKTIGKDNITEKDIKHLRNILSKEQKENLLKESKSASKWIYSVIKKVCVD